jgi:hypothetical protein
MFHLKSQEPLLRESLGSWEMEHVSWAVVDGEPAALSEEARASAAGPSTTIRKETTFSGPILFHFN